MSGWVQLPALTYFIHHRNPEFHLEKQTVGAKRCYYRFHSIEYSIKIVKFARFAY